MEVGDDRWQRGRDDRLIESRQEHPEHQRADDDQHTAVAEVEDGPLVGQSGRRLGHRLRRLRRGHSRVFLRYDL